MNFMREFEERPWGTYEVLLNTENCKVKRIIVNPNEQLSVQYHNKRSELWKIISGKGQILIGNDWIEAKPGVMVEIPQGAIHSVKAIDESLVFIEIQTGTYFGEDDIVRLSDKYNR
jgi:mannose-6-phosphate isomerase